MPDNDLMDDPSLGGFGNPNLPAPPVPPTPGSVIAPPAPGSTAANWSFGGSGGPARRPQLPRSPRSLAIALVVIVAVAAGSFLVLNRKGLNGDGTAFALSLVQGESYRYEMGITFNGTISAGGQQIPFNMKATELISWKVESFDQDGVANVTMYIEKLSATVNGTRTPSELPPPIKIKVAKDGRILTAGNIQLAGQGDAGTLFPGSDQFVPLLPDHPVRPGDYWTKEFDQAFPFGKDRLHYETRNLYLRDEVVNGVNAAVISTSMKVPMDFSIDLDAMAKAMGEGSGQFPSGAKMSFGGSADFTTLAWLDFERGVFLKSSGNGQIDMTVELKGVPNLDSLGAAKIGISGNMGMNVTNLGAAPKPSPTKAKKKSGK